MSTAVLSQRKQAKKVPCNFKMTMKQDLRESEIAFRNQFNPNHPDYHSGDPTPVPTGGSRIPNGLHEEEVRDYDYIIISCI